MKTLKRLCFEILTKKCTYKQIYDLKWLNCGLRCIQFKTYFQIWRDNFWYCDCKKKEFKITKPNNSKFYYTKVGKSEDCSHCHLLFLIKIKLDIVFKYKNKLVRLCYLLKEFFKLLLNTKVYSQIIYRTVLNTVIVYVMKILLGTINDYDIFKFFKKMDKNMYAMWFSVASLANIRDS